MQIENIAGIPSLNFCKHEEHGARYECNKYGGWNFGELQFRVLALILGLQRCVHFDEFPQVLGVRIINFLSHK